MKYVLIIAGILCSIGISIYYGIERGQEKSLVKYYCYHPSSGKEEVTLGYYDSIRDPMKKKLSSEVLFNSEVAYLSGLKLFSVLIFIIGSVIFIHLIYDHIVKNNKYYLGRFRKL